MIKKYCSNYVFSVDKGLLKYAIVVVEDSKIIEIVDTRAVMREIAGLEFYSGLLVAASIDSSSLLELINNSASFEDLFSSLSYSESSLIHLSNLDFSEKRLLSKTIVLKLL